MRQILLLVVLWGYGLAQAEVLATVGPTHITREALAQKMKSLQDQTLVLPTMEQLLEDMIRVELSVQEADKLNLKNDPLVNEQIRQILSSALLEKKLGNKVRSIKISERELREFYRKNPEIRISHVLVEVKEEASASEKSEALQKATRWINEIQSSQRSFEDLAKNQSADTQTRESGGDIGFQSRATLFPAIYKIAAKMKVGEVKGPIESPFGFHIIKVTEIRDFDLSDKQQLRNGVLEDKRNQILNEYFEQLKGQYKVENHLASLKTQVRE